MLWRRTLVTDQGSAGKAPEGTSEEFDTAQTGLLNNQGNEGGQSDANNPGRVQEVFFANGTESPCCDRTVSSFTTSPRTSRVVINDIQPRHVFGGNVSVIIQKQYKGDVSTRFNIGST